MLFIFNTEVVHSRRDLQWDTIWTLCWTQELVVWSAVRSLICKLTAIPWSLLISRYINSGLIKNHTSLGTSYTESPAVRRILLIMQCATHQYLGNSISYMSSGPEALILILHDGNKEPLIVKNAILYRMLLIWLCYNNLDFCNSCHHDISPKCARSVTSMLSTSVIMYKSSVGQTATFVDPASWFDNKLKHDMKVLLKYFFSIPFIRDKVFN